MLIPIEVSWDDASRTLLRWDLPEMWNWETLRAACRRTNQMIRTEHPDLILNAPESAYSALPAALPLAELQRVLVNVERLIVVMGDSALKTTRGGDPELFFVRTLTEARHVASPRAAVR